MDSNGNTGLVCVCECFWRRGNIEGSGSVRVHNEDVYLHPGLEFWMLAVAKGDHTEEFGRFGQFLHLPFGHLWEA